MEHAAEGPLAGREHCFSVIGRLSFENKDSLGGKSQKQWA
jgi:hypothetical protein